MLKELKFIDLHNGKEYIYQENMPYKFYNESVTFGPVKIEKSTLNNSGCFLNRTMPFYEQYFRTVSLNDTIYAVVSHKSSGGYLSTLYEYNPDEDIWNLKSELSGKTVSTVYVAQFDGEIYTMRKIVEEDAEGSIENDAEDNAEDNKETKWIIEKYNPATDTWLFLTDVNCESLRDIVAFNKEIYIIEHNEVEAENDTEDNTDGNTKEDNKIIRIQKYNPSHNTITTILEKESNMLYFTQLF